MSDAPVRRLGRLAINGRFLLEPRPTGTQRCSRRILEALLPQVSDFEVRLAGPGPGATDPPRLPPGVRMDPMYSGKGGLAHLVEQVRFPVRYRNWTQLHCIGTGPFLLSGPRQVMFLHDLNYRILPDAFSRGFRLWYRLANGLAATQSARILCISQYVADYVVRMLGIPSSRIRVVHLGPGIDIPDGIDVPPPAARQLSVLCVGSLQPHKNLRRILQSWAQIQRRFPEWKLTVVGRPQDRFTSLGIDDSLVRQPGLEFTGYIDDRQLADLYRMSSVFVFPSLEEGFGMPVVESFQLGCPVITSNRSCLPEVAGGAALLVDPLSVESIAEGLARLMGSGGERARWHALGRARGSRFTWKAAAAQVAQAIREVTAEPAGSPG